MSHRPKLHLILIGAGALSVGAAALAQPAPPADRAALKTKLEQRFDALDANRDGTVTPEERKAKRAQARDEMRAHLFARLDTDKNGAISKEEFASAGPLRPEGKAQRRGHGKAMKHHGFAARQDKNQPLTRTAFVDAGLSRFDRVDTDHDGKISPAERDAARKAMRDRLAPADRPAPPPPVR